ncbi:MAG: MerR family transcriptional regulator [Planctomycetota bacterium]|nr:MerR family transcriptional regulator [Planctomycetota bacterium]
MDKKDLLKIGDFAALAGTNLRTLRYYEELGLLEPTMRSQGGFRYYRKTDVNRMDMIRRLQDLGLQLDEIRGLLGSRDEVFVRENFIARVRGALETQDALLAERMKELGEARMRLARALEKVTECSTCAAAPNALNNFCEPCQASGTPLPKSISALF